MKPLHRLGIFLAVVLAVMLLLRAIFIDPVVADTSEHQPTAEEIETTEEIEKEALAFIAEDSRFDKLTKRDAHPYAHGCVKAKFTVLSEIEPRLQRGVFANPGHAYPAWVRFSNGTQADDRKPDGRGIAIKLMGVPGRKLQQGQETEQTQDFVMVNYHTFLLRDVREYLAFFRKQAKGDQFGYFIGWNPLKWHLREMRVGLAMLMQDVPSPLATTYHSMLPYKLGSEHNIKYSALPCDPEETERCEPFELAMPKELTEHYLRDALVVGLTPDADEPSPERPRARFVFRVQLQDPNKNMPIEDASITWQVRDSPFLPVAELTIEAQRFNSDEQNRFCENLSFTPWHALAAHEPIGGLNRARRVVYDAISKRRHERNGVVRHEPRGFCLRLDGKPCSTTLAAGGGS